EMGGTTYSIQYTNFILYCGGANKLASPHSTKEVLK
ncbi:MAG: hypothetical protein RIT41_1177, partial [Bacteroidota bacterium]